MNRRWTLVTLIALSIPGLSCSNSSEDDFAAAEYPDAPTQQIAAGDEWTLEVVRPDGGLPCWRIRVEDQTTRCMSLEYSAGSASWGSLRGPNIAFEFVIEGGEEPVTLRWFSSLHDGLVVESYSVEGVQLAVVEVADGEEPWGMQMIDADGALVQAWSLVDGG